MPAARSRDRRAYISYPPPMPRELSNWFCPFRKTSHNYELYLHYDSSSKLRYEAPKEKRKKRCSRQGIGNTALHGGFLLLSTFPRFGAEHFLA